MTTEQVPAAPPNWFIRPRNVLVGRLTAITVMTLALVPVWPWMAWVAAPFWAVCLLAVRMLRRIFAKNLRLLHRLTPDSTDGEDGLLSPVTLIAAARNEEEAIEVAVRSFAAQDYPDLKILIVNDHSTDSTGAILDRLSPEMAAVRVIHDPPLQEGWLGKANAVWYAVQQTTPETPWLCLTDGDIVMHPKTLRRAVGYAERMGFDFLTCVPRLENETWAEEIILPRAWGGLIAESDMERFNTPMSPPVGIGAFILVKREAYLASGGHSVRPANQPEDTLLAETVKRWGGRMGLAWTSDMIRVRLYRGLWDVYRVSVRKNRVNTGDSITKVMSQLPLFMMAYLIPAPYACVMAAELVAGGWRWGLGACCILALWTYLETVLTLDLHRPLCRMHRITPWLAPITGLLRVWIELSSLMHILLDRPMEWRGRAFEHKAAEEE